jgi:hypothetical protein
MAIQTFRNSAKAQCRKRGTIGEKELAEVTYPAIEKTYVLFLDCPISLEYTLTAVNELLCRTPYLWGVPEEPFAYLGLLPSAKLAASH